MKKTTFILTFLWLVFGLKAQTCQEVFVSEVVFSKDSTQTLIGSTTWIENYALELYNPTTDDIDLSQYSIHLISQTGNPTIITLTDSIKAQATYVISKLGADYDLTSVAELITNSLDYDNFEAVELYKNGDLLDRIGQTGLAIPDSIDIVQTLANPTNYLNSLNIDLSSIEQLVFRRNPMIGEGNPAFDSLSKEWHVVPNGDYTDVHHHTNICKETDVIVEFAQDFYEVYEGQSIVPAINVYNFDSATSASVLIDVGKKVSPPYNIAYPFYIDNNDMVTPTHASLEVPYLSFSIIVGENNPFPEPDEVVMYELEKTLINGKINPAKRFVTILIHNNTLSAIKNEAENLFVVYPNPTTSKLFLEYKSNTFIEEISIKDLLGNELYKTDKPAYMIDLQDYANGTYILSIRVVGKIYHHKITKN